MGRCSECQPKLRHKQAHHAMHTAPVSLILQCKLVSDWELRKQRSVAHCGPYGSGRSLLFSFAVTTVSGRVLYWISTTGDDDFRRVSVVVCIVWWLLVSEAVACWCSGTHDAASCGSESHPDGSRQSVVGVYSAKQRWCCWCCYYSTRSVFCPFMPAVCSPSTEDVFSVCLLT